MGIVPNLPTVEEPGCRRRPLLALLAMDSDPRPYDIGIVGAGQLARMTCLAGAPLGLRIAVLGHADEPAAAVAAGVIEGQWQNPADVAALGRACRVVTLENEFVDAASLAAVEVTGTPVRPTARAVGRIQDKALQKQLLRDAGLPVPQFEVIRGAREAAALGRDLGWPMMLKARTLGYDGYGNALCRDADEAEAALTRLDRGEGVLAEEEVRFARELAAMIARNGEGDEAVYPVVETRQRNHVCHEVIAPADGDRAVLGRAADTALSAARTAEALGVMGVELFELHDGRVLVNELAPRPHNSGHYTIEACETSQFENHVRGVLGLPLGDVSLRTPAAVMVNILGSRTGPALPTLAAPLAGRGVHLHLYDKSEVRMGRKMGHVTVLSSSRDDAREAARAAAAMVGL